MRESKRPLIAVLAGSQRIGQLLPFAMGFVLISAGTVLAQDQSGSQPNQPLQTAARSKVPAPGSQQQRAVGTTSGNPAQSLVAFEEGQLSINATDVSLADLLFAVRAATGADIDIPLKASSERVTAQLGPGPARKVLTDLLGWSSFDYIIE